MFLKLRERNFCMWSISAYARRIGVMEEVGTGSIEEVEKGGIEEVEMGGMELNQREWLTMRNPR